MRGQLSRDEFIAGIERKPDRPEAAKTPPDNSKERPNPEKMFKRLDANSDGKVTLDEVPEPRQEMFKRLLERADEVVLLADSSKFEQIGGHVLCDLSAIDVIVSDAGLALEHQDMIAAAGVRLILA